MKHKDIISEASSWVDVPKSKQLTEQSLEDLIQKNLKFESTPDDVVMFWSTLIVETLEDSKFSSKSSIILKKLIAELRDNI